MAIIETDREGMPIGVYGATYYTVRGGRATRQAGGDSGLSAAGVRATAERLAADEVMVATCQSQSGGLTAYGSEDTRRRWREIAAREREQEAQRERSRRATAIAAAESPWDAAGAHVRVARAGEGRVVVDIDGAAKDYRLDDINVGADVSDAVRGVWVEIRRRAVVLLSSTRE